MSKVYSKALDKTIEVDRLIGSVHGSQPGPTIIFTAGIHGNEPSGIFALHQLLIKLESIRERFLGSVYAISGNLWALERQKRFDQEDLNRLWTRERMRLILEKRFDELPQHQDTLQQLDIYQLIEDIMSKEKGPFFFLDLHTTSSETMPFLTVNDTLLNRKFSQQYPVPIILGIEEFLEGPLLSYINYLGYVAVGFESGQHDDLASVENHLAFAYVSMAMCGCADSKDLPEFDHYYAVLGRTTLEARNIFEITYRHEIHEGEKFEMNPGYLNFQQISRDEKLALSNGEGVAANRKGRIFMPLYQAQGNDGFFIVRKTPELFLRLSTIFRRMSLDSLLVLLPGIRWQSQTRDTLLIKKRIARFFAKEFLHLLGYRSREIKDAQLIAKNRERSSRDEEYKNIKWFRAKL